jgi:hypothetical protein
MSRGFVWGVAVGFVAAGLLGVGGRLASSGVAQQPAAGAPPQRAAPLSPDPDRGLQPAPAVDVTAPPAAQREPTIRELLAQLDGLKRQQGDLERQYREAAEQVRKKYEAEREALDRVRADLERRGILRPEAPAGAPPVAPANDLPQRSVPDAPPPAPRG